MTIDPSPNQNNADDTTTDNQSGALMLLISSALEGLGGEYNLDQTRIAAAGTLLGTISAEWQTNQSQAQIDLGSLLAQLNALFRDHNDQGSLADAIDAAETLLGIWSGDDYQ
jgi:hypothetical protein